MAKIHLRGRKWRSSGSLKVRALHKAKAKGDWTPRGGATKKHKSRQQR